VVSAAGNTLTLSTLLTTEKIAREVVPAAFVAQTLEFMQYSIPGVSFPVDADGGDAPAMPKHRWRDTGPVSFAAPLMAVQEEELGSAPMQRRGPPTFSATASKQLRAVNNIKLSMGSKLDLVMDSVEFPCDAVGVVDDVWRGEIPSEEGESRTGGIVSRVIIARAVAAEKLRGMFAGRAHVVLKGGGTASDTHAYNIEFLPDILHQRDAPYPVEINLGTVDGVFVKETVVSVAHGDDHTTSAGTIRTQTTKIRVEIVNPSNRPLSRVELWKKSSDHQGNVTTYGEEFPLQADVDGIDVTTGSKNTIRIAVPAEKPDEEQFNLEYTMTRQVVVRKQIE